MAHIVSAPNVGPGDVYILGAGFSRAAFSDMPLTDELGRRVLERLQEPATPPFSTSGLTFESWLSWLGEPQPFDDAAAALERRARFVRLQDAITDEIREAEREARQNVPVAFWLAPLLQLFQLARADVITFNYDRVVEQNLPPFLTDSTGEFVREQDVVAPFFSEDGLMFGTSQPHPRTIDAFTYLKLHGSVDWWIFPNDITGASLEQGPPGNELNRGQRNRRGARRPFVIPPSAAKSGFYGSELTHFLWQCAAAALRDARRVALVGYSLPLTDSATAAMLFENLAGTEARIDVVDLQAGPVVERLVQLGCAPERIQCFDGPDCVHDYVEHRIDELAEAFAPRLVDAVRPADNLAFAWSTNEVAQVERAELVNDGQTLLLLSSGLRAHGLVRSDAVLPDGSRQARALRGDQLPAGYERARRVVLAVDSSSWSAVGLVTGLPNLSAGPGDWTVFYPVGTHPAPFHSW